MDKREDTGNYYPGGTVVTGTPVPAMPNSGYELVEIADGGTIKDHAMNRVPGVLVGITEWTDGLGTDVTSDVVLDAGSGKLFFESSIFPGETLEANTSYGSIDDMPSGRMEFFRSIYYDGRYEEHAVTSKLSIRCSEVANFTSGFYVPVTITKNESGEVFVDNSYVYIRCEDYGGGSGSVTFEEYVQYISGGIYGVGDVRNFRPQKGQSYGCYFYGYEGDFTLVFNETASAADDIMGSANISIRYELPDGNHKEASGIYCEFYGYGTYNDSGEIELLANLSTWIDVYLGDFAHIICDTINGVLNISNPNKYGRVTYIGSSTRMEGGFYETIELENFPAELSLTLPKRNGNTARDFAICIDGKPNLTMKCENGEIVKGVDEKTFELENGRNIIYVTEPAKDELIASRVLIADK